MQVSVVPAQSALVVQVFLHEPGVPPPHDSPIPQSLSSVHATCGVQAPPEQDSPDAQVWDFEQLQVPFVQLSELRGQLPWPTPMHASGLHLPVFDAPWQVSVAPQSELVPQVLEQVP